MAPLFRNMTIFSMISFCLCSIADIAHLIIHLLAGASFSSPIEPKVSGMGDLFYYVADISFYALLLGRLYRVFEETEFKLSKVWLCILFTLLMLAVVAATWHTLVIFFFFHSWAQWLQLGMPATCVLSCNDFVLNMSLFILFYYKLKQTITTIQRFNDRESINRTVHTMFNVMAKHSVLYSVAIITNQLFFIGVMLMAFTDLGHDYFTIGLIMILVLRAIEDVVNVLALWLILPQNKHIYRCCCGCCHRCVGRTCQGIVKNGKTGMLLSATSTLSFD